MEQTNTQERNLFSKNIVELKLISDRIAEGKGEAAGIFSNTYQILYILDRKERVTPKELIAELNMAKSNLPIKDSKKLITSGGVYGVIGDIEIALDSIIAMQEVLIGGDAE